MPGFYEFFKPIQTNEIKLAMFTNRADYLPLIPLVLTILLAGHRLVENFYKNIVHVRKCFQVLAANILVVLFSFYIRPSFGIHHFLDNAPFLGVHCFQTFGILVQIPILYTIYKGFFC